MKWFKPKSRLKDKITSEAQRIGALLFGVDVCVRIQHHPSKQIVEEIVVAIRNNDRRREFLKAFKKAYLF